MPSTSNLFFRFVFSLVARCAKSKGEVAFLSCSAVYTAGVFFRPLLERVLFTMFGWCNQNKVLKAVVLGISVFMMHVHSFWCICYHAVLVFPTVRLCNFYANVEQPIAGFVKFFCADWQRYADFVQYLLSHSFGFWRKRFVGAVRATRSVMVGVAVKPLFAYDLSVAKWAKFERKFFGHSVFYTKHDRIANAF